MPREIETRPESRLSAALFRLLEPRLGTAAIAVFRLRAGAARLWAGTPTFARLAPGLGTGWQPLDPAIARALAGGTAGLADAGRLGLPGGFAAVAPVGTAAFVLMLDPRRRRWTPAVAAALGDGAALLAPLLARIGPRAAAGRPDATATLPRAAAHRLVERELGHRRADARVALLVLDLDRFRAVNEALGAAAGDALLAVTGARLEQALGQTDRVVRMEGDRFLVLADRRPPELRALAARILDTVAQPLTLGGRTVAVQASIGVVADAANGTSAAELLARAETALRRAKVEGRNRFVLHEPRHNAAVAEKSRLELDLAEAVAQGQMHLVYQPYVALDGGAVGGFEALLRWRHPIRGELQPASFIPLAEATGLILPIGRWAMAAALARAARWPPGFGLSVNISALQFHQPDFTAEVDAALRSTGFPAGRLELEITETVLMRDNPQTIGQLDALIARGVRIALDDFGTGYSALAYLARLPHHRIKLDRAFVRDLANPATAELIRAIIALARARGVDTTAEGVETPDQVEEVRRMGFTHAQGFATGAPVVEPSAMIPAPDVASAV